MSTSYTDHEFLKQITMNQYTSLKFGFQFLCVFTFQSWVLNHLKLWCKWNIHTQQLSIVLYFWYSSTRNCHVEFMCSRKSSVQGMLSKWNHAITSARSMYVTMCVTRTALSKHNYTNRDHLYKHSCGNKGCILKTCIQFFSLSCLTGFGSVGGTTT